MNARYSLTWQLRWSVGVLLGMLGAPRVQAQMTQLEPNCLVPLTNYWSSPSTWSSGVVPGPGETVVIGAPNTPNTVVLDVSPPPLGDVFINGSLIWKDVTGLVLEARSIHIVGTGHLRIGCETNPFTKNKATIRLSAPGCQFPGNAGLFVEDGGTLDLWGKPRSHSWIDLASSAAENQPGLVLAGNVNWPLNSLVAIASSDFDCKYFDQGTIAAVSGPNLTLNANLTRRHFAGDVGFAPFTVPERAEVALLSRNIVVEGTLINCPDVPNGINDRFAGHVRIERTDPGLPAPVARLSWVEFRNLGNEGELGNYPLHFHKVGDLSASLVRSCSIHHCFNRGLAVHDSQNLTVTNSVAFDSIGHMFYMEESTVPSPGPVTGCHWTHNLVFMTRAAVAGNELSVEELLPAIGTTSTGPSSFWLENFDNEVFDNHAAGSEGMGFWMDVPALPFSAGYPQGMRDNVAHSNLGNGFYFDDFVRMNLDPISDPPLLRDLVAWKNRGYGVYARALGTMVLENLRVADNLGGIYLASAGDPPTVVDGTVQHVTDSVVLGEPLQNLGAHLSSDPTTEYTSLERNLVPPRSLPVDTPWCQGSNPVAPALMPLLGVTIYDGMIAVDDTVFDYFKRFSFTTCGMAQFRDAAAFAPVNYTSPWAVDPRGFGRNLTFGGQVERVAYLRDIHPDQDGIANSILFDVEGDLLASWRFLPMGLPVACSNTGPTYLFPDNPFLLPIAGMTPACTEPSLNGHAWTPGAGECFVTLDIELINLPPSPPPTPSHARYWRSDYSSSFSALPLASFQAFDAPLSRVNYATNAALAAPSSALANNFLVSWEPQGIGIPRQMHVSAHYGRVGATLYFILPYDFNLGSPFVSRDPAGIFSIPQAANATALINSPQHAWLRYLGTLPLGPGSTWQAPHSFIGKIVVEQGVPDAITQVVNDPGVASFFDGDIAHFYIQ